MHIYDYPLLLLSKVKEKIKICCKKRVHIIFIYIFDAAKLLLFIDLTKYFEIKMQIGAVNNK